MMLNSRSVATLIIILLGVGWGSACMPAATPPTAPPPAPTSTAIHVSGAETRTVAWQSTPSPAATAASDPASPDCGIPADHAAIRYQVNATLDYAAHTVTVEQQTDYRNTSTDALTELVFYVPPNAQPDVFTLDDLSLPQQEEAPPATLEGARLTLPLSEPLPPGCAQQITLAYTLRPPRIGQGYFPRQGYFGYEARQFNLGNWLPVVAHRTEAAWLTPQPFNIGEQAVLPMADFEVALTVENAPDDLTVVGPGIVRRQDDTWTFTLAAGREIALTMSTEYHRLATTTPDGTSIELYTLDDAQPPAEADYNGPQHALEMAALALEQYADLYGPYLHERLVIVESAFPDGMEFSGLVFVGGEWFRSYDGDPAGYLTLITVHEVSHQWWYLLVANDQSAEPWLDEALATYSEHVFLEENYPDLLNWWWDFRVNAWSPAGLVDASIYEFNTVRHYINAVYLRGAQLMHALRQHLGGEAFFAWLHEYADATQGQIATADDLWNALPGTARATTYEIRADFLRDPGPRE